MQPFLKKDYSYSFGELPLQCVLLPLRSGNSIAIFFFSLRFFFPHQSSAQR